MKRVSTFSIVKLLSPLLVLLLTGMATRAQYVYTINADSVKITNHCDTAELILENHTQNVPGFLFNKGRGRTEFRRALQKLNTFTYLVGGDTLSMQPNPWLQGGNTFGATGILGTFDNNHLDIYTNSTQRARWTSTGNFLLGTTADNGYKFQVAGTGGISIDPNLSRPGDRIRIGTYINSNDGQNTLFSTSSDGGLTYKNILAERDGNIGLGYTSSIGWVVGHPNLRIRNDGVISLFTPGLFFGNTGGPWNSSALVTSVSNLNEWLQGEGNYPNGQNYYYFGTVLQSPEAGNKRAPLKIGGRELHWLTGAVDTEAARITEPGNLLLGTTTDNGSKLQVNGASYFNGSQRITGSVGGSLNIAHTYFTPTITAIAEDWNYFYGTRITPAMNFSGNYQQGYAVDITPTYNLNGNVQHTDAVSAALHVSSNLGGIRLDQISSYGGNTGQPLFIYQGGGSDKEAILNMRNGNSTSRSFIWNSDNRPVSNSNLVIPALRSTINTAAGGVHAGGGISFTLDRYYYGTEASIEMKYELTPAGDTASTLKTGIGFNTIDLGYRSAAMYISGTKIGIGTTTPAAQLHSTGSVRFAGLTADTSLTRVLVSDAAGNLYYRNLSSWAVANIFHTDIAVKGTLTAQKVNIRPDAWADYVFDKTYRLPSLYEIEDYIKQNKHLPGIPSAAEVKQNGIDVGESHTALLKKIEELTLYVIGQEKKNQEQNEEIKTLKEQNKELATLKQEMAELKKLITK